MRWVAYVGARSARTRRRVAAGEAHLVPRDGVVTFRRRVAVPVAGGMSGGLCAEFDLTPSGAGALAAFCRAEIARALDGQAGSPAR